MTEPGSENRQKPSSNWSSDKNLLFAIMALRVGFIDSERLVAALHSWADSKAKPISSILIDLGFLSNEAVEMLKPLVDNTLKGTGKYRKQFSCIKPHARVEVSHSGNHGQRH